jgi:Flp pilus assembly pilin Flp
VIAAGHRVTNHREHCHCTERAAAFPPFGGTNVFRKAACFDNSAFAPTLAEGGESMISGFFRRLFRNEDGQTMAEYGVVLAVITIGVVATLILLSGSITNAFNAVIKVLPV